MSESVNPLTTTINTINYPQNNEVTSRSVFYATYPTYMQPFAMHWLRRWLQWFDGNVQGVHDGSGAVISTRLASTLCHKVAQQIFGGGLLFQKKGVADKELENKAIKFISGEYNDKIALDQHVSQAILLCVAGGTSFIVENATSDGKLWLSTYRMDEGYFNIDFEGRVSEAKLINSKYIDVTTKGQRHFILVEEREIGSKAMENAYNKKYKKEILLAKRPFFKPGKYYQTFNVYETTGMVNQDSNVSLGRPLAFSELPKKVQKQLRYQFKDIEIGVPKVLPFDRIGIIPFKYTNGVDNLPNLPYGQSMLQNIMSYLYLYDYEHGALNTDLYLGRGRVLAKKSIQNPDNRKGAQTWNSNLDSFLFTTYEGQATDEQKPVPVQFDLRSNDWEQIKNNILESIAMTIGVSASTMAGWLNDSSNRTAREISSEESSTALLVESKRKLLTRAINELINDILQFNGYVECVEVKFSKSGETNTSLLLENTTNAYNSGLKSLYAAVKAINPDMSEDELQEEIARIKADAKDRQAMQPLDFFNEDTGAFNEQEKDSEGEGARVELANDSNRGVPNRPQDDNQEVSA